MGVNFKKLVAVNELIERGDFSGARNFYTDDVKGWSPTYEFEGIDAWIAALTSQNGPFSDIATTMTLVAETGDVVVGEWSWAGTHTGTINASGFELSATGKRISMKGMSAFEFTDGKISAFRQYWDNAAVGAQFM